MRRRAAVAAVCLVVPLGACSDDEDPFERYCAVVEDEQQALSEALSTGGSAGLLPGLPIFERLLDAAPDDIADDWGVVVQRLTVLDDALRAAGVDPATYDPVDPPDDVTEEEQTAIEVGASSVATEAVREALENVQQQARDVCKTELSL